MPTGYTAKLHDGEDQTFEEFALQCARNFGALITMRDESMDGEIPDAFQPSSYYTNALTEAQQDYERFTTMSDAQAQALADEEHAERMRRHEESKREAVERQARYRAMINNATRWQPPTPEHEGLRTFMIEQLRESERFDCSISPEPAPLSGSEYRRMMIERAERAMVRSCEQHDAEVERARQRTEWVRQLRDSLADFHAIAPTS